MTNGTGGRGRRAFMRESALALAGIAALPLGLFGCRGEGKVLTAAAPGRAGEPAPGEWRAQITGDDEPGERLVINGTVYAADGKTPLAGAILFVYHTDARGLYADRGGEPRQIARLRARVRTGRDGRYELRTIKAAPYPGRTMPAHIHALLTAPGAAERWIDEYWFEGDPLIPARERTRLEGLGSFSPIMRLSRGADGVLRGVRDIKAA
jgi:protocatechuate 3,4-dioxygenase, beta subunit